MEVADGLKAAQAFTGLLRQLFTQVDLLLAPTLQGRSRCGGIARHIPVQPFVEILIAGLVAAEQQVGMSARPQPFLDVQADNVILTVGDIPEKSMAPSTVSRSASSTMGSWRR